MFILSNLIIKDKLDIKITNKEGMYQFESKIDNLIIKGKEKDLNCNFYVSENTSTNILKKINIIPAKHLECEICYETGIQQIDYNKTDLIRSFGSKKTVERLKTYETDGYLKTSTMKFSNKSQILPKINQSDKLIDCFLLEDLFNKEILDNFNIINFEDIELLDESKRFYDGTNKKIHILLLDGLLRLINFKYITDDVFDNSEYSCLIELVREEIENRRLTKISKDKLIIKIYILILQIRDGKVKLNSVPSFNLKIENGLEYFKLLGCVYNKNTDEIRIVNRPIEYSNKY